MKAVDALAPGTRIEIASDVLRCCWLASLAYACGWNRVGRHYLVDAEILMVVCPAIVPP